MTVAVKKAFVWKKELDSHPGAIAEALAPLARATGDLQRIMVYRFPDARKGAIEFHPISARKLVSVANGSGFAPSSIRVLLVEGDNRKALGSALTKGLGDAG